MRPTTSGGEAHDARIGGVDLALWDIRARSRTGGAELLGGARRERIEAYGRSIQWRHVMAWRSRWRTPSAFASPQYQVRRRSVDGGSGSDGAPAHRREECS